MHCRTAQLKTWIDRPSYGAPQLTTPPSIVHSKCSILDSTNCGTASVRGNLAGRTAALSSAGADVCAATAPAMVRCSRLSLDSHDVLLAVDLGQPH
jgi:hypothetical protein